MCLFGSPALSSTLCIALPARCYVFWLLLAAAATRPLLLFASPRAPGSPLACTLCVQQRLWRRGPPALQLPSRRVSPLDESAPFLSSFVPSRVRRRASDCMTATGVPRAATVGPPAVGCTCIAPARCTRINITHIITKKATPCLGAPLFCWELCTSTSSGWSDV